MRIASTWLSTVLLLAPALGHALVVPDEYWIMIVAAPEGQRAQVAPACFLPLPGIETAAEQLKTQLSKLEPAPRLCLLTANSLLDCRGQQFDGPMRELVSTELASWVGLATAAHRGGKRVALLFFYLGHGWGSDLVLPGGELSETAIFEIFQHADVDYAAAIQDRCRSTLEECSGSVSPVSLAAMGSPSGTLNIVYSTFPEQLAFALKGNLKKGPCYTLELIQAFEQMGPTNTLRRAHTRVERELKTAGIPQYSEAHLESDLQLRFQINREAIVYQKHPREETWIVEYEGGHQELVQFQSLPRKMHPGHSTWKLLEDPEKNCQLQLEPEEYYSLNAEPLLGQRFICRKLTFLDRWFTLGAKPGGPLMTQAPPSHSLAISGLATLSRGSLLPELVGLLEYREDRLASLSWSVGLGYGNASQQFSAWSYRLHAPLVRAAVGFSLFERRRITLSPEVWALLLLTQKRTQGDEAYTTTEDESSSTNGAALAGLRLELLPWVKPRWLPALQLAGGGSWAPGISGGADHEWGWYASLAVSGLFDFSP